MARKTDSDQNVNGKSLLKELAENQLSKSQDESPELNGKTPGQIIHELQVHQIELEMQNEELRRAQLELEVSMNQNCELYDFAPVGYFTLSHKGIINEVYLTGAALLGMPRSKLIGRGFGHFVPPESHEEYYQHIISVLKQEDKLSRVLKLKSEDGSFLYVRLESIRADTSTEPRGETREAHVIRMAVIDITERKVIENAFILSENEKTAILNGHHQYSICQ